MKRTTIMLPPDLRSRAKRYARERGMTLGELVREALDARIGAQERDPIFRRYPKTRGEPRSPGDLSTRGDEYQYGERSS